MPDARTQSACFITQWRIPANTRGIPRPGLFASGRDGWECRRCGQTFSDRTPTMMYPDRCQFEPKSSDDRL